MKVIVNLSNKNIQNDVDPSEGCIISQIVQFVQQHDIKLYHNIIDIGAHDGLFKSNSYYLIRHGWNAILIEPNPDSYNMLIDVNRNYSKQVATFNIAIGYESLRTILYKHRNSLRNPNSNHSGASLLDVGGGEGWDVAVISCKELIESISWPGIGIFSIDAEGYDIYILKSLFETEARPQIIITEIFKRKIEQQKHQMIIDNGYQLILKEGQNKAYVRQ